MSMQKDKHLKLAPPRLPELSSVPLWKATLKTSTEKYVDSYPIYHHHSGRKLTESSSFYR